MFCFDLSHASLESVLAVVLVVQCWGMLWKKKVVDCSLSYVGGALRHTWCSVHWYSMLRMSSIEKIAH